MEVELVEQWLAWYAVHKNYTTIIKEFSTRTEGPKLQDLGVPYSIVAACVLHQVISRKEVEHYEQAISIVDTLYPAVENEVGLPLRIRITSAMKCKILLRMLDQGHPGMVKQLKEFFPQDEKFLNIYEQAEKQSLRKQVFSCLDHFRGFFLRLVANEDYRKKYMQTQYNREFGIGFENKLQELVGRFLAAVGRQFPTTVIEKILTEGADSLFVAELRTYHIAAVELLLDATANKTELSEGDCIKLMKQLRPPFVTGIRHRNTAMSSGSEETDWFESQAMAQRNLKSPVVDLGPRRDPVNVKDLGKRKRTLSDNEDKAENSENFSQHPKGRLYKMKSNSKVCILSSDEYTSKSVPSSSTSGCSSSVDIIVVEKSDSNDADSSHVGPSPQEIDQSQPPKKSEEAQRPQESDVSPSPQAMDQSQPPQESDQSRHPQDSDESRLQESNQAQENVIYEVFRGSESELRCSSQDTTVCFDPESQSAMLKLHLTVTSSNDSTQTQQKSGHDTAAAETEDKAMEEDRTSNRQPAAEANTAEGPSNSQCHIISSSPEQVDLVSSSSSSNNSEEVDTLVKRLSLHSKNSAKKTDQATSPVKDYEKSIYNDATSRNIEPSETEKIQSCQTASSGKGLGASADGGEVMMKDTATDIQDEIGSGDAVSQSDDYYSACDEMKSIPSATSSYKDAESPKTHVSITTSQSGSDCVQLSSSSDCVHLSNSADSSSLSLVSSSSAEVDNSSESLVVVPSSHSQDKFDAVCKSETTIVKETLPDISKHLATRRILRERKPQTNKPDTNEARRRPMQEEYPRSCPTCGKVLTSKCGYRNHMRRHDGITMYKCIDCNKGFIQKFDYENHRRKEHTGEKLNCSYCSKTFFSYHGLRSHNIAIHKTTVIKKETQSSAPVKLETRPI